MGSECKRIILLKGLELINDYQFSIVKSLLAHDLGLTTKMQEEYNKINIADLMEKKFRGPLCVDKLINLLKDIEGLGDVVKTLRNEKRKVMRQSRAGAKAPVKKRKQDASGTDESISSRNEASGSVHDKPLSKKKKKETTQNDESKRTQPTQEQSQLLEPSVTSTQSTWSYPQTPQMPPPTPGSSSSTKKKKIKTTQNDESKRMQPPQGQSQLPGPSVTITQSPWSYPQTPPMPPPTPGSRSSTKKKKIKTTQNDESKRMQPPQGQSQLPGPSVTITQSPWSYPQTPPMPPPTPGSRSSTKKKKIKTTQNDESKRMQPPQGQSQLPGPSVTITQSPWSYPQTPPMPPPTPGSRSSTKKKKIKTTQNDESKRMQPPQGQSQLPGPSVTITQSPWSYPQTPPMPPPTPGSRSSTKKKKIKTTQNDESKRMQPPQGQSQLPGPSVTITQSPWNYPQTPPMPPPTPGSSSSTKKKKIKTTQNDESKRMQPPQGQSQLPGPSVTITQSPWSYPQTPPMPPPTPGSRSSTKKVKMETIQNDESKTMQPPQGQSQLPGPSVTTTQSPWSYPQTPPMPPPTPGSSSSTKRRDDITTKTDFTIRMQLSQEQGQLLEPSAATSTCPNASLPCIPQTLPNTPSSSSLIKKPRLKVVPRAPSIEEGFQKGPKEVMVLRATEPFAYDLMEAERKMFHATVATESQFFQVKVFHVNLKEKFIPKKVIAISDYYGRNGFLEVYNAACVSDVNADRKMEISSRLIQNANATPKINSLYSQEPGTFVSGIYQVHKKNVLNEHIIWYEIQDETGKMEVLVYGRLTKVNCEEGDKLKLICFELSAEPRQLRSVIHSFIKVIKSRKTKKPLINPDSQMETSL
ncbi:myeloid cell nuclear differentiation antigen-like protein isoform X3 [Ailuropoda melanoleuca]|uniref:myeloid cell nuclear differentiation antigen-like protein isoform X3 n=1 Tax=Ailuropoda melanoleuca TaxID=9646 RepID=UPI0014941DA8|nr:myeloid cell nuclear differentiation antigen-like protein isoform X3 [Ailuropoda melanoleuca]